MLFTQPIFLIFFATVFCLHWTIRSNHQRKVLLLIASYVFYAAWDWRFLGLIVLSTGIDYTAGLILRRSNPLGGRRLWLGISLASNLGILGFFKYYNFFVQSGVGLLQSIGIPVGDYSLNIILPVGISFFTFQSMSYTIDVYRKNLEPITGLVDFALFVAFFPQLVAGPIVRASEFLPQLRPPRVFASVPVKKCIALFLAGFFKKACIADNLAPIVDQVYASPGTFDVLSIWIATGFYAVQIYCDFSGYTDMAIAIANLFGFRLSPNFNFPYFAANIREFWRRWHISLSTWLRDYLYISLGGNRGGALAAMRNLMITMLLGGLWHGASWNFVLWGALHGTALVVHRVYSARVREGSWVGKVFTIIGPLLTLYCVCIAWIFFRAPDLESALACATGFILMVSLGSNSVSPSLALLFIPLVAVHALMARKSIQERMEPLPNTVCAVLFGVWVFFILLLYPLDYRPFIYFQF